MILTQEFLTQAGVCADGQKCAEDGNYIGMDYDAVIKDLLRRGLRDDAGWLQKHKATELYVRLNGATIMTAYNVFNPLTGINSKFTDLELAKQEAINVANQVLDTNKIIITSIISNENGDEVWTTDNTIQVSLVVNSI